MKSEKREMPRPSSSLSMTHSMKGTSSLFVGTRQTAGLISRQRSSSVLSEVRPNRSSMNFAERGEDISSASDTDEMTCLGGPPSPRAVMPPRAVIPPRLVICLDDKMLSSSGRLSRSESKVPSAALAAPVSEAFRQRADASPPARAVAAPRDVSTPRCARRSGTADEPRALPPRFLTLGSGIGGGRGSSTAKPPARCILSLRYSC
mmetsp:Transcript_48476/g.126697  ORF Transcript_48476/g.126697 Transcript_48476/m.126697 type:complete len:205 (+) Transcript_48476:3392-4006(+)